MSKSYKKPKNYFTDEDFAPDEPAETEKKSRRQRKLTEEELTDLFYKEGFGG